MTTDEPVEAISAPYYNRKGNEPISGFPEPLEQTAIAEEDASIPEEVQALALVSGSDTPLMLITPKPLEQNAAAVYLTGLSMGSRRTMGDALNLMAQLLTGGQQDALHLALGILVLLLLG